MSHSSCLSTRCACEIAAIFDILQLFDLWPLPVLVWVHLTVWLLWTHDQRIAIPVTQRLLIHQREDPTVCVVILHGEGRRYRAYRQCRCVCSIRAEALTVRLQEMIVLRICLHSLPTVTLQAVTPDKDALEKPSFVLFSSGWICDWSTGLCLCYNWLSLDWYALQYTI